MNSIKNLERLQKLHLLIQNEQTGPPKELARKLHVSERSVYSLLEELKDYEANIEYDRTRKTYYYQFDFQLNIDVSISILNAGELISYYQL